MLVQVKRLNLISPDPEVESMRRWIRGLRRLYLRNVREIIAIKKMIHDPDMTIEELRRKVRPVAKRNSIHKIRAIHYPAGIDSGPNGSNPVEGT